MSYRKTGTTSYNQRRQLMQRFREDWSKGLPDALTKAAQMEKDGWQIDTSRTLMAAQAKERVNELKANGFDSETIPIATWDGEQVVLLAAKASAVKPTSTSSTAQTSSSIAKITRFVGAFGQGLYDGGIVSSKDHAVTFIANGANPTGNDKNPPLWLELADGIKKNVPNVGVVDSLPLLEGALEYQLGLTAAHNVGKEYVAFDPKGDSATSIKLLLPALKVFSEYAGNPHAKVMLYVNQVGIAMLEDKEGDRILIGPNYDARPTDANVIDVQKLLLSSQSGTPSTRV